jgi:rare lipoprotein A
MMNRQVACRLTIVLLGLLLSACAGKAPTDPIGGMPYGTYKLGTPYQINGIWYYPEFDPDYDAIGTASWYGKAFHGRPTANGETFDMRQVSAAHPTLPMPSLVEVTNLQNGRSLRLRVNDRGPFHDDRLIDLSQAAARELGFESAGLAKVRVRFISLLPANGTPPIAGTSTRPSAVVAAAAKSTLGPSSPVAGRYSLAQHEGNSAICSDAHFVQVAAVSEEETVRRLAAELMTVGEVNVEPALPSLTRVRLGPYPNRRDAFGKLAEVRELGFRDALVVSCS